jgi:hypothetical protein
MHPSGLEDADWMPLRRPEKNFGKCLRKGGLEMESESIRWMTRSEESSTVDEMPIRRQGVFLDGTRLSERARTERRRTNVDRT